MNWRISARFRARVPTVGRALRAAGRGGLHLRTGLRRSAISCLRLLYPAHCHLCAGELRGNPPLLLCRHCRRLLVDAGHRCLHCAATLPSVNGMPLQCPHCRLRPPKLAIAVCLGSYRGAVRDAVLLAKQERYESLTFALGELLAICRQSDLESFAATLVVPVPMQWGRRMRRGINNAETLAAAISRHLRVPLEARLLVKQRRTEKQGTLTISRRAGNVQGAFAVRSQVWPKRNNRVQGQRVLIVDDVMTSGSTVDEVRRILVRAGASAVGVAVLARGLD